ncbi:uncharacterized protein BXZ73DRAFT_57404 [Epithele typhae]|uniref:uncharacterized protein n=1 Tax=Epithele typhae TaxID=378194 RepID=UPI00200732E2|nr:uncharacterized protein BXZ73DRAFT_57404 [Epithele typhae]KAH9911029.1 hypothetical protein BXZ73DRAFT_57404 [Epithele typhae]
MTTLLLVSPSLHRSPSHASKPTPTSAQWMFGPLGRRPDDTPVFATPVGDGDVPMAALEDLGFFAHQVFDRRADVSGCGLKIAPQPVGRARVADCEYVGRARATWKCMFRGFWVGRWDDVIECDCAWMKEVDARATGYKGIEGDAAEDGAHMPWGGRARCRRRRTSCYRGGSMCDGCLGIV